MAHKLRPRHLLAALIAATALGAYFYFRHLRPAAGPSGPVSVLGSAGRRGGAAFLKKIGA